MVVLEFLAIGGISLLIGGSIGIILAKYTNIINFVSKNERYKQKIMNDPELLIEKLKEHGEITDFGKKLDMSLVTVDGKKEIQVKMKEEEVKVEEEEIKIEEEEEKGEEEEKQIT